MGYGYFVSKSKYNQRYEELGHSSVYKYDILLNMNYLAGKNSVIAVLLRGFTAKAARKPPEAKNDSL
jgi:hypothetical protein